MTTELPPLALIAGPTASGKSDCAVRLALALKRQGRRAVVINADSAQVYADLAVLSARPSIAACNAQMNAGWFPEDEANVAAWLNKLYYRFDN